MVLGFLLLFVTILLALFLLVLVNVTKILVILGLSLGPPHLILLVLHHLLGILGDSPPSLAGRLGLVQIIGDHPVIEDGAGLHLPQVDANLAVLGVLADILGVPVELAGSLLKLSCLGALDGGLDPGVPRVELLPEEYL